MNNDDYDPFNTSCIAGVDLLTFRQPNDNYRLEITELMNESTE